MCVYISVEEYFNSPFNNAFANCAMITGAVLSGIISGLIDVAQSLVDNYIGREFCPKDYEEIFRGDDSYTYFTDNKNILGISGITFLDINSGFNNITGTIDSSFYKISDSKSGLIRITRNFSNGLYHLNGQGFSRNHEYSVIYRAGYETIPSDIKTAMCILVTSLSLAIDTSQISIPDGGTIDSIKLDKMGATYGSGRLNKTIIMRDMNDTNNLPVTVFQILNRYKGM